MLDLMGPRSPHNVGVAVRLTESLSGAHWSLNQRRQAPYKPTRGPTRLTWQRDPALGEMLVCRDESTLCWQGRARS